MVAPNITVAFYEQAIATIQRGNKGVIAMIVIDSTVSALAKDTIYDVADIPMTYSSDAKSAVSKALMGYVNAPKKVIVVTVGSTEALNDALDELSADEWDYLVCPTAETDELTTQISSWIKSQRTTNNKIYKAVLPNTAADHEGVINVTTGYTDADGAVTAEKACARVAGIIAGTPMTISCTYAPIPEASACDAMTSEEIDEAVDDGKLVFDWDGEKVKIVRGVNSLQTTAEGKGESYKKIKLIETMDMIKHDIRKTAQDSFIGKYANSYDNKCLLITAINGYFDSLVREGILSSGACQIDVAAQRNYFKSRGGKLVVDGETISVEDATDMQIKKGNTGSQVFLRADISMLDALEDIEIDIYF